MFEKLNKFAERTIDLCDLVFNYILAVMFIVAFTAVPVFLVMMMVLAWMGHDRQATISAISCFGAAGLTTLIHFVGDALYG